MFKIFTWGNFRSIASRSYLISTRFKSSTAQALRRTKPTKPSITSPPPTLSPKPQPPQALSKPLPLKSKIVGGWLLGTSALVFGIVILGGVTRLTESGLSMVDWSLLGTRPPSTQKEWEEYFEKYKQFPEYKV